MPPPHYGGPDDVAQMQVPVQALALALALALAQHDAGAAEQSIFVSSVRGLKCRLIKYLSTQNNLL